MINLFIEFIASLVIVIGLLVLLTIQYIMIIIDIKNNNVKYWEIIVGIIPLGPYILMILTGIWHLLNKIFNPN